MADEKPNQPTPPKSDTPPPKPSPPASVKEAKAKGTTYTVHVPGLLNSKLNRRYRQASYPEDAFLKEMADRGSSRSGTVMVTKD